MMDLMYWFHVTLYTRVPVNVTKRMNKSLILRCTFLHKYFIYRKISPLHPEPIQLRSGMIKNPNVDREACTTFVRFVFSLVLTPKTIS